MRTIVWCFLTMIGLWTAVAPAQELRGPVRLEAGGKPIDVDVGHAAPYVRDMDRDGKPDLLVGQFGKGKLRVYQNMGTREQPQFEDFTYFQAGGADATIPAG
jgi:hypothetical protein